MKSRNLLARKLELFYRDIHPKKQQIAKNEKMRLQTDLEFQQNEIKKMNQKCNVEMFSSRVRGGKTYAAKQTANGCIKQLLLDVSSKKINT